MNSDFVKTFLTLWKLSYTAHTKNKSKQLYGTYYLPGTILYALQISIRLIILVILEVGTFAIPILLMRKERSRDLLKATQVISKPGFESPLDSVPLNNLIKPLFQNKQNNHKLNIYSQGNLLLRGNRTLKSIPSFYPRPDAQGANNPIT